MEDGQIPCAVAVMNKHNQTGMAIILISALDLFRKWDII
jgi:hypothetical protein